MSSLRDLLTQDGFHRHRPTSAGDSRRRARRPSPSSRTESAATTVASDAPTTSSFLCRDRKSVDISAGRLRHHGSPTVSSGRTTTSSARGSSLPPPSCGGDTAAISVLSGYVGQFSDDPAFRRRIHERCSICLSPRRRDSAHAALVNLDMAIATVERLAEKQAHRHHRSLRNCAKLLDLVASLSSPKLRAGCSCGVPNLHLAAVAQLYLAVVHKMRGDDGGAAGHLLQLFCDVPHLARKSLLPELWENFFLPRLVHLEVWFDREREALESAAAGGEGERRKWLYRTYSDQMDLGTMQLAIHYKQCLLTGDFSVAAPPVPLPPPPPASYRAGSGKRSASVPPSSLAANPYVEHTLLLILIPPNSGPKRFGFPHMRRVFVDRGTWHSSGVEGLSGNLSPDLGSRARLDSSPAEAIQPEETRNTGFQGNRIRTPVPPPGGRPRRSRGFLGTRFPEPHCSTSIGPSPPSPPPTISENASSPWG